MKYLIRAACIWFILMARLFTLTRYAILSFKSGFTGPSVRTVVNYVQGQYYSNNIREYFYYVDHQGQLFLDDAKVKNFISCFQDREFLAFFFRQVKINNTGRYENDFPYVSPCGREKNFIRYVAW